MNSDVEIDYFTIFLKICSYRSINQLLNRKIHLIVLVKAALSYVLIQLSSLPAAGLWLSKLLRHTGTSFSMSSVLSDHKLFSWKSWCYFTPFLLWTSFQTLHLLPIWNFSSILVGRFSVYPLWCSVESLLDLFLWFPSFSVCLCTYL